LKLKWIFIDGEIWQKDRFCLTFGSFIFTFIGRLLSEKDNLGNFQEKQL